MSDREHICELPDDHPSGVAWRCPECGAQVIRLGRVVEEGKARGFGHVKGMATLKGVSRTKTRARGMISFAELEVPSPPGVVEAHESLPSLAESADIEVEVPQRETAFEIIRKLVMNPPTDEDGAWIVRAYDEQDRLLATTVEPTEDDALLAMTNEQLWFGEPEEGQ